MASQLPSFDVLMELAQNDPEKLEEIRQKLSEEIFADATPHLRPKLEGLNFRINMERQRSKNAMQSCLRISALMHDSFEKMRQELDVLVSSPSSNLHLTDETDSAYTPIKENVIPFPMQRR